MNTRHICKTSWHCINNILFWILCANFCFLAQSLSQYKIDVQSLDFVDFCEPVSFHVSIEKAFNSTFDSIELIIEFTEDVIYISNDLGLELKSSSPRKLTFNYPDLRDCKIQNAEIVFTPDCFNSFTTIQSLISLKSDSICLAETEKQFVVKNPFINIVFSDYTYLGESNELVKTINLNNVSTIDIDAFYILPRPADQFATLTSTSIGTITNDTLFISSEDLNGASLKPGNEMLIELIFALNICSVRAIDYEIGFLCESSGCYIDQQFLDENDIYENSVFTRFEAYLKNQEQILNYGICEAEINTIKIFNLERNQFTSIADIYSLNYDFFINLSCVNRFTKCIDLTARVGDLELPIIKNNDSSYNIDFEQLMTDPDGRGGLEDLDGDGQFDDLPLGDSTTLSLHLLLDQECEDNYDNLSCDFSTQLNYSNYCGESVENIFTDENNFIRLSNYFSFSIPRIQTLQRDGNNKSYINEGDTIFARINIRKSNNISKQCQNDRFNITVDVPPTLKYLDDLNVVYFDNSDTIIYNPHLRQDTLLEMDVPELDSSVAILIIPFTAICDIDNNTSFNSSLDLCKQCVEYDLPRIRATIEKPCQLNCATDILLKEGISGPFYTSCGDIPELEEFVILDSTEFYNISRAYTDPNLSELYDPFISPSSSNNRYYIDGDTMLIRIPFHFNCTEELTDYSIVINENQLINYNFEIIETNIHLLSDIDNSSEGSCSADLFLNQSDTDILFNFNSSSFSLPCLSQDKNHYLEIKLKFTYNCELNANCGLATLGTLRTYTTSTLLNNCTKRTFYDLDTIYINEVFKEEFFNPVFIPFTGQVLEVYDSIHITANLYSNIFNPLQSEPLYKHLPVLREINYTVPPGFEIISDLMIINKNQIFLAGDIFGIDNSQLDTLISIVPAITNHADGSKTYRYTDDLTTQYSGAISEAYSAGVILKNICAPEQDFQEIRTSGIVEYMDYANDRRVIETYQFNEATQIQFAPERYTPIDNFQIIDTIRKTQWEYQKFSLFNFGQFSNEPIILTDEFIYQLKYSSDKMNIDSVTLQVNDSFGSLVSSPLENIFIGDSIIEIKILPESILSADGSIIYTQSEPGTFIFHTSNHGCGFDTLFFELGRKAQFSRDTCSRRIFNDFFVSYSAPGFPQLEITDAPPVINTFGTNQFSFTLSNVGQGALVENKIVFQNMPDAEYSFFYFNEQNELENISELLEWDMNTLQVSFNGDRFNSIRGLAGKVIRELNFILVAKDVCANNNFFELYATAESKSFCGDEIISPPVLLQNIPYIIDKELNYSTKLESFANPECQDTASLRITIQSLAVNDELINPTLRLLLPNDLRYYTGTTSINGKMSPDPETIQTGQNRFTEFVLSGDALSSWQDSAVIELKFDGSCIDLCRQDTISTFFMSEKNYTCANQLSADRIITRGYRINQGIRWKPDVEINNLDISVLNSDDQKLSVSIQGEITITETPIYGGDITSIIYADLNQNKILDPTDLLIKETPIPASSFKDHTFALRDSISMRPELLCQLHLLIDLDKTCSCLFSNMPISQGISIPSSKNIFICSPDEINVNISSQETCLQTILLNEQIISQTDTSIVYRPDLSLESDTIHIQADCNGCQFSEQIIIRQEVPEVKINLQSSESCELSAEVLYNNESQIPQQFHIEWSTGENTQRISDEIQNGMLRVQLIDQLSECFFTDSIFIDLGQSELIAALTLDEAVCTDDFPLSATVDVFGQDPVSIIWQDGNTNFMRSDIEADQEYSFVIEDGRGCVKQDTFIVAMPQKNNVNIDLSQPSCEHPDSGEITISSTDSLLQYSLDGMDFKPNPQFDSLEAGIYTVFSLNALACIDATTIELVLNDFFEPSILTEYSASQGSGIMLNQGFEGGDSYSWQWESETFELDCDTCPNPSFIATSDGIIQVTIGKNACTSTKTIFIAIRVLDDIYVPNVFKAGIEGANDKFYVYPNNSFDEIDFIIYDRWGNLMYESLQASTAETFSGWDGRVNGTEAEPGVYVFKAKVRRIIDDYEVEILGDFLLVR